MTRRVSYQLIMITAALALTACGPKPTAVIERHVEPCPLAVEPPDCPDFPDRSGKPWEVVLDERDLTYARCRGWAETFWKARQECAAPKR